MLKFKVHIEGLDALKDEMSKACTKAEGYLSQQIMKDTAPYVPFLTGSLNQRTRVDGRYIIYPGPYARFLYYGKVMVDPETGSPFAEAGARKVLTDRDLVFTKQGHSNAQAFWFEASKAQNEEKWIRAAGKAVRDELK